MSELPSEYKDLTKTSPKQNEYWQALAPEPEPQLMQSRAREVVNDLPRQRVDSSIVPTQEIQARFHHFAGNMEQMEQQRLAELRRQEWLRQYAVERPPRTLKDVLSHWKDIFTSKFKSKERVHSSYQFDIGAVGVGATRM